MCSTSLRRAAITPSASKASARLGRIGATPAVVNAVVDALVRAGRGDRASQMQMPLTPEKVWQALHEGKEQQGLVPAEASVP